MSKHKKNKCRGFHKPNGGNPILSAQKAVLTAQHLSREAQQQSVYLAQLNILLQLTEDACLIATSEVRGLGPENAATLRTTFRQTINEMSAMLADDEDKEIVYGKAKIDQRLAQIEGPDKAKPWEERLAWCTAKLGVLK